MSDNHPDFEAVPEAHRWTGNLIDLGKALRKEAFAKKGLGWAWYVLPRGAMVAMMARDDMRRVLRVSRRVAPTTPDGWVKWRSEVGVFRKHLDCDLWAPAVGDASPLDPNLPPQELFIERHAEEVAKPKCNRCGAPVSDAGLYKEDLCVACAKEAGDRESARLRATAAAASAGSTSATDPTSKPNTPPGTSDTQGSLGLT